MEEYLEQAEQDRQDLVDNLETKGITGLTGDETFTQLVPEVLNIPSGSGGLDWSAIGYSDTPQYVVDGYNYAKNIYDNWDNTVTSLSFYFNADLNLVYMPLVDTSNVTNTQKMCYGCNNLENFPLLNTSNVINMNNMFYYCSHLETIPQFNTSSVTDMSNMFTGCSNLKSIPQFNTSSVTKFNNFIDSNVKQLTDTSLNNILKMCIGATTYTGTKTLYQLGFRSSMYSASKIQGLTNYQDFIDAGWTIGY